MIYAGSFFAVTDPAPAVIWARCGTCHRQFESPDPIADLLSHLGAEHAEGQKRR